MTRRIVRKTKDVIEGYLRRYAVDHLHYLTPITNTPSILAIGIFSYNKAQRLPHQNVALWSVQERRESIIPKTGKRIHDYVPLYFATHTPMQYVLTQGAKNRKPVIEQKDLIFIEVDAHKILSEPGVIFTDGNAAATETTFYTDIANLNNLDWKIIKTLNCYSQEYKRKKAAEVLVPDHVPVDYFKQIVVFNQDAAKDLTKNVQHLYEKLKVQYPFLLECVSIDATHYY